MAEQAPEISVVRTKARPCSVFRRVRPQLHADGHSASNFIGDVFDMRSLPGPDLTIPECDLLGLLTNAVVPDPDAPDGLSVVLTVDELSAFLRLRTKFIKARDRQRKQAHLIFSGSLKDLAIPQATDPSHSEHPQAADDASLRSPSKQPQDLPK